MISPTRTSSLLLTTLTLGLTLLTDARAQTPTRASPGPTAGIPSSGGDLGADRVVDRGSPWTTGSTPWPFARPAVNIPGRPPALSGADVGPALPAPQNSKSQRLGQARPVTAWSQDGAAAAPASPVGTPQAWSRVPAAIGGGQAAGGRIESVRDRVRAISNVRQDAPDAVCPPIPGDFVPWWLDAVARPLREAAKSQPVDVNQLVLAALQWSHQVQAISEQPLIRKTAVIEAQADFDPKAFMESKFTRLSEPVGDTLTTGGPPRWRQSDWFYQAGVRKKTTFGGTVELSQRWGYKDSNSLFFDPPHQGNAQLVLSYEQPLLNGAGQAYNTSLIVLAEIDTAIAWNRTARDLQAHLMDVTTAYWDLYLQRAALLQMDRSRQRAEEIMTELQRRRDVDSLQSQIARARSAVATRRAQLIRTEASIRNAEAKLRALINAPDLCAGENLELIPLECPTTQCLPVAVRPALVTALENRPEIDSAVKDLDAAAVRLNMSRNELLPMLSLVLESHVSGLEGHSQVGEAWQDQFRKGEPSYAAGLKFEVPLYNRAAQARHQRRQLELRQLTHKFNATVETLLAEVEVAVRDVNASYREMHGKFSAMTASLTDVEYITERWKLLPGDDRAASFLLEDLLDAQDRLANEEFGFSQAQINYAVALAELKRATGTLLSCRQISPQLIDECGLPRMLLGTGTARGPSEASVPAAAPTSPPADTPPLIAPAPASSTSAAMLPGRSAPVGAWLKSH